MDIKYLGHSSFRIRGKNAAIVTDPFDPKMIGFTFPKTTADIVTVSHEHADHNNVLYVDERQNGTPPVIIRGPGEYEIKGVKIYGYKTYHDDKQGQERGNNTVYVFTVDGITIMHCGDLGHQFSDELLDQLDEIQVLMIPTGGVYTVNEKEALRIIRQIEPSIVIPMHYKTASSSKSFEQLSPLDSFLKEIGKSPEPISKLSLTHDKLPEEMEVVVLSTQ